MIFLGTNYNKKNTFFNYHVQIQESHLTSVIIG